MAEKEAPEKEDVKGSEDTRGDQNVEENKLEKANSEKSEESNFEQVSGARLEDVLELGHLEKLRELFTTHVPKNEELDNSLWPRRNKLKRDTGNLTLEEFKETLGEVLGKGKFTDQLEKLFAKLDTSCDGHVDWSEFCTYLLLYMRENDYLSHIRDVPFCSDPRIRHLVHNRQEPTTRLVMTDNPTKLVSVSKGGALCVMDSHMTLEAVYHSHREEEDALRQKRRFHMWVMDAVYMRNCHKLVLSTSARDLRFFDFGSGSMIEFLHLFALPNIVMCLDYYCDPKNPSSPSQLFCGDESGGILHFTFLRPTNQLFEVPHQPDQLQRVWIEDITSHARFVSYTRMEGVHNETIQAIRYMPDNQTTVSCSISATHSVVVFDVTRQQTLYRFRMRRGCECFELSKQVNLLVTGSADYMVRVWNPYVTNRPSAILQGHTSAVLGARIHERRNQAISYARDGVIKVWDLKDYTCLQTVNIRLPSQVIGKVPEHMFSPLLLHHNLVLVSMNDYIIAYKLGKPPEPVSLQPVTHKTQLCCAIYNGLFKQVVTGSDDSCVTSWDVETGNKCLQFNNAHEDEEITCIVFDHNFRRMFTGARNGTVKVWNIQNGHQLHALEPVAEAEVTGILPLHDRQYILTVGWSRTIARYHDNHPENFQMKVDLSWKGGKRHRDDIMACDYCPPHLVATGSFDGEIIVWSLETEQIMIRLRVGYRESLDRTLSRLQGIDLPQSRPNSRHRKNHKPPPGGVPPPVDKLLFLRRRVVHRRPDAAVLISSEAGTLRWWYLYGHNHDMGHFYAPKHPDESVLGLCASEDNSLLISGDTGGWVRLWSISGYCIDSRMQWHGRAPNLLREFSAHEAGALVSVALIDHATGRYILTASTDCSARLFDKDGSFVGTFGQRTPWSLKNKSTWEHFKGRQQAFPEPDTVKAENGEPEITETQENGMTVTFLMGSRPVSSVNSNVSNKPSEKAIDLPTLGSRSHTTMDSLSSPRSKLGCKAELDFLRIRESRHQRRMHYGDVETKKALRFGGKHCSPFAALSTTDFKMVQLPSSMLQPQTASESGHDVDHNRLVSLDPFLKNMDDSIRIKREKTWAHSERSKSIVKLPTLSRNN